MTERRLILLMSVSFDGFVARSDGVIDWLTPRAGAVDHGARRHQANLVAVLMNSLPKLVYSQSLSEVAWNNARLSRAAPPTRSRRSRRSPAGTWSSSAALASPTA